MQEENFSLEYYWIVQQNKTVKAGAIKQTSSDLQNQINRLEINFSIISKIKNEVFVYVKFFMLFFDIVANIWKHTMQHTYTNAINYVLLSARSIKVNVLVFML